MRWGAVGLAWIALLSSARPAAAQGSPPSEKLVITARSAFSWSKSGATIVQLGGDVQIVLDRATLSADRAVVWLTPVPNAAAGRQHAEFELVGHAVLRQPDLNVTRSGDHLFVAAELLGDVRINADERVARDMSGSEFYVRAQELRRQAAQAPTTMATTLPTSPSTRATGRPSRPPTTQALANGVPVTLEAGQTDEADTEEGTVAIVASNGVKIFAQQANGEQIELQSQRAVLFTVYQSLRDVSKKPATARADATGRPLYITAVYLEGDVRIEDLPIKPGTGEQRLMAERVYYEMTTDRAILVNAVLHTITPQTGMPFIVRGKILRQLSKGEYDAKDVQLTSSEFAVPSYSMAADRLYVRSEATGDPQFPERIEYEASSATVQAFDVPFFYFPFVSGSVGDRPGALRGIGFTHRDDLGYGFMTEWGLFETLGQVPPRQIDASYRIDYFTDRGPGFGLDAAYGGGVLTESTHQPWNFEGDFKSYFIYDHGSDEDYGRLPVKPGGPGDTPRGWALFQHQFFLPSDWQAQVRLGYVSDPTFLEEWFPRQFYEQQPVDESAYLKRQRDDEAFTLLVEGQPNRLVTSSDWMAEQFEVERLPEVGYHRVGDSWADNSLTFFSDDSAGGLQFQPTGATLRQQGFSLPTINPGIPALGQTGVNTSTTWRADFRQEIDWPLNAGLFKVVPYLVGRYTEYSNSPGGGQQSRFFGVAGTRINANLWKIDPTAESDIFDIHQLRHVIEPEVNLFTSGTTVDRSQLFMYDTPVDAINDVSAVDLALRQRWQTQRGGPGRWHSVDVFSLDLDAEFYANKPNRKFLDPFDFRGLFFPSLPEASVPRDALNADATWRISDNTVILGEAQYNLDESKLATAAIGILVRRDVQQSWYIGNRYIADLHSNIATIAMDYQISPKYTLAFSQSFDFGLGKDVSSSVSAIRYFDRFVLVVSASHDQIANQTSFAFNIIPIGLGNGLNSSALQGPFHR